MPRLGPFKFGGSRSGGNSTGTLSSPSETRTGRVSRFFSRSRSNVSTPNPVVPPHPPARRSRSLSRRSRSLSRRSRSLSRRSRSLSRRSRSLSDRGCHNANPAFQEALEAYKSKLSPEEYAAFESAKDTFHSPEAIVERIEQSNKQYSRLSSSRKLADRFQNILGFLNQYLITLDPHIQPSPEISALVVGGFKFGLELALRFAEFADRITRLLEVTADELSILSKYATSEVFRSSKEVQEALVATYGDLLDLCKKIREIFTDGKGDSPTRAISFKVFRSIFLGVFESQFSDIQDSFTRHAKIVRQHARVQENIDSIKDRQLRQQQYKDGRRSKLLRWLSNVDFDEPHQNNLSKRHANTGEWILESQQFEKWIGDPCSSFLWCHGNPGVGKTVLTSLVLDKMNTVHGDSENIGISFAYCNYKEQLKPAVYLATFLKQLLRKIEDWPEELQTSLENCHLNAKALGLKQLQDMLLTVSKCFTKVFIILDALDECENVVGLSKEFQTLFERSNTVTPNIKIFFTSRKEPDIERLFSVLPTIEIEATKVNADIELYVKDEIERRINSKELILMDSSLKADIVSNLLNHANGMFLWVQLQLDYICDQTSDQEIKEALQTLPNTLEETYERIVDKINKQSPAKKQLATKVLMWVACAARPLGLQELAQAIAIEPNTTECKELNMRNSLEIYVKVCMNLVAVQLEDKYDDEEDCFKGWEMEEKVRFVHYSVQEFFLSRLQHSVNPSRSLDLTFNIDHESANEIIARSCITFLLFDNFEEGTNWQRYWYKEEFSFLAYAAEFWDHHLRALSILNEELLQLVHRLLHSRKKIFRDIKGIRSHDKSTFWSERGPNLPAFAIAWCLGLTYAGNRLKSMGDEINIRELSDGNVLHLIACEGSSEVVNDLLALGLKADDIDKHGVQPLYYAAAHGNTDVVRLLLDKGTDVNLHGGEYGNALQAASWRGSLEVVRLLLEKGANVTLQGGRYGSALIAASSRGSLDIVRLLLDQGADINLQDKEYGNALQAASSEGYLDIVRLLLDRGAVVNLRRGNALQAASLRGSLEVVRLLLDRGADVNLQGGRYGNALQAAWKSGSLEVVRLLLEKGADINSQDETHGNGLQAASLRGSLKVVQLLLDRGADVNLQGGQYGNALQAAAWTGSVDIVRLLLDNGADVTIQGGKYGNALQAASRGGSVDIVRLLLDKGADVNLQGGIHGNPLQAALSSGSLEVTRLLLDQGADVNSQDEKYVTALQAASSEGSLEIVRLLLDRGADVNLQAGRYSTALQAAAVSDSLEVVRLLLDRGADVNLQGGRYRNALRAAASVGSLEVVRLLLDKGADISLRKGLRNALVPASSRKSVDVLRLLLDKGADINLRDAEDGIALHKASKTGSLDAVRLLLDRGADINLRHWNDGSALQAASCHGFLGPVRLLLDRGADINLPGGRYGNALQAASSGGYLVIVRLLLDKGADINAQGGEYGNALQIASLRHYLDIVRLLLDKGADINAQGGKYRTALQAALRGGDTHPNTFLLVPLLLDKGADVNLLDRELRMRYKEFFGPT